MRVPVYVWMHVCNTHDACNPCNGCIVSNRMYIGACDVYRHVVYVMHGDHACTCIYIYIYAFVRVMSVLDVMHKNLDVKWHCEVIWSGAMWCNIGMYVCMMEKCNGWMYVVDLCLQLRNTMDVGLHVHARIIYACDVCMLYLYCVSCMQCHLVHRW